MNVLKELPKKNISKHSGRSISIFLLLFFLAFSLFLATYVSLSLKNGMQSMEDRMGADIILVPRDAENDYQGALISGTPSNFYMDSAVLDELDQLPFVERSSPQIFVASADASCCSAPVQIIGIDAESDFSVGPWLQEEVSEPLKEREVYAGSNIFGKVGETIRFYDIEFTIKGKLSETGLGYDDSVFVNKEEANLIAQGAKDFGIESDYSVDENNISSVMIDVDSSALEDPTASPALEINRQLSDYNVRAISSNDMIASFSRQMNQSSRYILIIAGLLWVLSLAIIVVVFSMIVRSRSKEWQALQIIGAKPDQIRSIVLKESSLLSVLAAIFGVFFAALVSVLFASTFENAVQLPVLSPSFSSSILIGLLSFGVCAIAAPLAAAWAINRQLKSLPKMED